jgi:hypothetical protein
LLECKKVYISSVRFSSADDVAQAKLLGNQIATAAAAKKSPLPSPPSLLLGHPELHSRRARVTVTLLAFHTAFISTTLLSST